MTPWTLEACRRVIRDAGGLEVRVTHVYGWVPWPDHSNRRCVDFMTTSRADNAALAAYIVRHAEQLRVRYLIRNRRQWRAYAKGWRRPRTWAPYLGAHPHYDHVHVEFAA